MLIMVLTVFVASCPDMGEIRDQFSGEAENLENTFTEHTSEEVDRVVSVLNKAGDIFSEYFYVTDDFQMCVVSQCEESCYGRDFCFDLLAFESSFEILNLLAEILQDMGVEDIDFSGLLGLPTDKEATVHAMFSVWGAITITYLEGNEQMLAFGEGLRTKLPALISGDVLSIDLSYSTVGDLYGLDIEEGWLLVYFDQITGLPKANNSLVLQVTDETAAVVHFAIAKK